LNLGSLILQLLIRNLSLIGRSTFIRVPPLDLNIHGAFIYLRIIVWIVVIDILARAIRVFYVYVFWFGIILLVITVFWGTLNLVL